MSSFRTTPLGYLLTWTTYGTWLPGDSRGWQRKGTRTSQPPNKQKYLLAQSKMNEPKFLLSNNDRLLVEEAIKNVCHFREWILYTTGVQSNHVHVVVGVGTISPKDMSRQFKSWSTRALKTINKNRKRFWTEGCSCRSLFNDSSLGSAIVYVSETQNDHVRQEAYREFK